MTTQEKAKQFDRIRQKAHELAREALAAGAEDAQIVFSCTQPSPTPRQANQQAELPKMKAGPAVFLWRNRAGF
jgi:hypothetical protein